MSVGFTIDVNDLDGCDAHLKSVSRGFGGDNAIYHVGCIDSDILVTVGWALLSPYITQAWVCHDDRESELLATLRDQEYISPQEALRRCGCRVVGTFNNCSGVTDFNEVYIDL